MPNKLPRSAVFSRFFLLFSTLVWYSMTVLLKARYSAPLPQSHAVVIDAAYFVAIVGSSIGGAVLTKRMRRDNLLFTWIILGVVTSLLPLVVYASWEVNALAFFFLGIGVGLGLPACLSFFIDRINIEKRGHVGGLALIVTSIVAVAVGPFFQGDDLVFSSAILVGWRFLSLLAFFVLHRSDTSLRENSQKDSEQGIFASVLRVRTFALYFTAWLVFSLIDSFESVIVRKLLFELNLFNLASNVNGVVGAFSVFFAGLLADRIGRKKIVISGFVALGVAYAIVGLVGLNAFWYLHSIIDGMAGGIFMIVFVLLIWGDLSPPQSREMYYAIGNIPFFASRIIGPPTTPYIVPLVDRVGISASFSLAAFFLFVAVLPLMFAPETLPQEKMEQRRLQEYLQKAKKAREKYDQ